MSHPAMSIEDRIGGLVTLALGVVLADVAATWMLDGLPLIVGWAASGLLFAALARSARASLDQASRSPASGCI